MGKDGFFSRENFSRRLLEGAPEVRFHLCYIVWHIRRVPHKDEDGAFLSVHVDEEDSEKIASAVTIRRILPSHKLRIVGKKILVWQRSELRHAVY